MTKAGRQFLPIPMPQHATAANSVIFARDVGAGTYLFVGVQINARVPFRHVFLLLSQDLAFSDQQAQEILAREHHSGPDVLRRVVQSRGRYGLFAQSQGFPPDMFFSLHFLLSSLV
jgi:hypothetical protein